MNRQRGFLGFGVVELVVYAAIAVAALAAIAGVVYKANHWCNTVCKEARAETAKEKARADGAEQRIAEAQKRASDMTMLWDRERQGREADARARESSRIQAFGPVEAAARGLSRPVARTPFPRDAARVLDSAIAAGNAALARPAAEPAETAAAPPAAAESVDVAGVTQWGVACAKQYAALADQVIGWQTFYRNLQLAQAQEAIH